jgi:ATP-dependent Clp protease adaptor protein ClpS
MAETDSVRDVVQDVEVTIRPPSMYDVIFYDDNKTYYEFVVLILMHLFGKDYDTAVRLTDAIHVKGRHVVATYTHEVAASKRDEAVATARTSGHPLRVEIEPSTGEV